MCTPHALPNERLDVQNGQVIPDRVLALENLFDLAEESVLCEWFQQERLPRGPQPLPDRTRVLGVARKKQDAGLGMRAADEAALFEPVHAGHHDISNQQIDRAGMFVCKRERLVAVFCHDEVVTGPSSMRRMRERIDGSSSTSRIVGADCGSLLIACLFYP